MKFNYKARTPEGGIQKGEIQADSKKEALSALDSHDLTVLEIVSQEDIAVYEKEMELPFLNKVSQRDLVIFSRELATLIGAKVGIVDSLRSLSEQVQNPRFQEVISKVAEDVEGGASMSKAMSRHPNVFSNFYVNLIRSAEAAGTLDKTLNYLADYQERRYETKEKIKGAMMYPAFIVGATVIIGILVMIFIIPKIETILKTGNVELPLPTRLLIAFSGFMRNYWYLLIVIVGGLFYGFWTWIHSDSGRKVWDRMLLKIPYFGGLFRQYYLNRMATNLGTLIRGGLTIIRALEIASRVVGNSVYEEILLESKERVRMGKNISSVLSYYSEIPPMFTEMVKVGEKSGNVGGMLDKLAEFYRKEVDRAINNLSQLIEPVLIILLGAAVAFLALSVILPIYKMTQAI